MSDLCNKPRALSMSAQQRPILPKPFRAAGPADDGDGFGGGPPGEHRPLPPPRRNTKAACETCRKSKVRCTGERPVCSRCRGRDLECVYLAGYFETQVQALKRKHEESLHENLVYKELYRLLVTVNEAEAFDILQRLRAGTDVGTIVRRVQEGDLLLQLALRPESRFRYQFPYLPSMPAALQTPDNPYLGSFLYEGTMQGFHQFSPQSSSTAEAAQAWSYSQIYLKPYHAAELIDGRLGSVKASNWTLVTADDNLFRQLLRAYLIHEYCVAPAFHKDYFLYDLARGKGHLCSPLLVNSVMAIGSHCHRSVAFRSQIWNPQNIGYRFLVEARRLWELEDLEDATLTTFQATILLSLAYNSHGMDKIGDIFLRHAVSMARKMDLFKPNPAIKSPRIQRAREFTAWAFFNFQTSSGYYFMRRPWLSEPPEVALPDPDSDPGWYGEFALMYPPSTTPTPMHWPHTFRAMCWLRVIMNRVAQETFGDYHPQAVTGLPQETALEIQSLLEEWYGSLPGPLRPQVAVFPCHMRLHLEYFAMHITLATTVIEEQTEIHSEADLERVGAAPVARSGPVAMRHLETVARLYYMRHGFEACDSFLAYFLALLASISLRALEGSGDGARLSPGRGRPEVLRSTLILAMKGLRDQGRHLHVCKVLFRLLRDRLRLADADILGRFVVAPGDKEEEEEEKEVDLALHTRSRFPVPIVKMGEDLNASILENLLEKYQTVSLESSDSSDSGNDQDETMMVV
ncbi:hypothetical protein N8I77_011965 [Diaporthe amygdali]|uniref:Zn(2)-C6 fungal-type domain-containing protein n=1 Tax=Phomopsis amygdali TaxID=1214568 RepID=A0AAD9S6R3_PHOAM|nr:hypothetical protein N8I77_011965 [Diaporthe amygdali]